MKTSKKNQLVADIKAFAIRWEKEKKIDLPLLESIKLTLQNPEFHYLTLQQDNKGSRAIRFWNTVIRTEGLLEKADKKTKTLIEEIKPLIIGAQREGCQKIYNQTLESLKTEESLISAISNIHCALDNVIENLLPSGNYTTAKKTIETTLIDRCRKKLPLEEVERIDQFKLAIESFMKGEESQSIDDFKQFKDLANFPLSNTEKGLLNNLPPLMYSLYYFYGLQANKSTHTSIDNLSKLLVFFLDNDADISYQTTIIDDKETHLITLETLLNDIEKSLNSENYLEKKPIKRKPHSSDEYYFNINSFGLLLDYLKLSASRKKASISALIEVNQPQETEYKKTQTERDHLQIHPNDTTQIIADMSSTHSSPENQPPNTPGKKRKSEKRGTKRERNTPPTDERPSPTKRRNHEERIHEDRLIEQHSQHSL